MFRGTSLTAGPAPTTLDLSTLDTTFEALIFDWDGTAVASRDADVNAVADRIQALCEAGVHVFVVSGTNVANIDRQLGLRTPARGRLHFCVNRGSEVYTLTAQGPQLTYRRTTTAQEELMLDQAAAHTIEALRLRGLTAALVPDRLNRRKIDLIPVPAWSTPLKSEIDLAEVAALATTASRQAGLSDPRITSDTKHIEIGLTDKSDSAHFAANWLAAQGVTGSLVLVCGGEFGPPGALPGSDMLMLVDPLARAAVVSVGPEPSGVPAPVLHLGGGPARFVELLDAQLARRRHHRVPQIDFDPSWVVTLPDSNGHVTWHDSGSGPAAGTLASHTDSKVAESIGALGNGHAATRGTWEEDAASGAATLLVGGVYTDDNHLLPGPNWTGLDLSSTHQPHTGRRHLDLRTGSLVRSGELRSFRFVSQTDPHALALRAESASHRLQAGHPLIWDKKVVHKVEHDARGEALAARLGGANGGLCVAARNHVQTVADLRVVERLATWDATPSGQASFDAAHSRLTELTRVGFDTLLADHRAAWAARWRDAQVVIEGDPACELASRFAIFNLLNAAPRTGEAGVGARGLTGAGYAGHVFWDADVFVLPALAALCPPAARTMLEYRIARLGPARQRARAQGHSGARFPWESAADGTEVTPTQVVDTHGELVDVLTGVHEEHVVADVAWAANRYAAWTGDTAFLTGPGADLITDTARYWASRVQPDSAGHGHFLSVMGPDEYHEVVDDSAYTAIMARWNLRCAADLENAQNPGSPEAASWSAIAESLVDGWDSTRGCYEQFAGYFDLEPLLMDQVGSPPLDADTLLGRPRVVSSQILKQADVIMAHHLIGEQMVDGSLAADLAFYEPRTAHGSSLSPAIYAAQLARAGQPERALELFKMAALIDLSDLTGSTAAGLHLATMGGVWQALAYGFCGLRERAGTLAIDPCLPAQWEGLGLTFHFGGQRVSVHATHDRVQVTSERPLLISVADHADQLCGAAGINIPL